MTALDRRSPTESSDRNSAWPVILVSMPFVDAYRPSIQLGLLKSIVAGHGFSVRTVHAHLDFAIRIGLDFYQALAEHRGCLVGDWLFSAAAFGDRAPDPAARLLDDFTEELSALGGSPEQLRARLLRIRDHDVPGYLDALAEQLPRDAKVVGFTSTFQQNTASFALARRLKERDPETLTVFGGANFDGVMGAELVRTVDCVDFAVIGEGDVALPRLLSALAAGDDPGMVPGVAHRVDGKVTVTPPAPPAGHLDDLPVPDYDEYFERAEDLGVLPRAGHRTVWLPIETARGCWWGAKHHCTFCGLNGTTMRFRAKSPDRARTELAELAGRYRSFRFEAVDNILDLGYLTTLFPALVADGTNYEIFYEVKANLTRAQLRLLRQAGVTHIQPGLESLSTAVLRLMRKGCTAAQNVNLLRWARYYDIDVSWNLLWGFPAETEEDYTTQAAAIPHLTHLMPPRSAARIWLERFSPLHAAHAGTPERSYRYVYPEDVDLDQVAYFFAGDTANALPDSVYAPVQAAVRDWTVAWQADTPPALKYWSAPHHVQIHDGRQPGHEGSYTFEGTVADLYLACADRPTTARAARDKLGLRLPVEEIEEVFREFQRRGLMFLDGSLALALALPVAQQR
jgi:ribosomal peptide maturation radical SAM protein 1